MGKLAIEGGKPVRKKSFPERIMFDDKEVKAVTQLIKKAAECGTAKFLDRYAGKIVEEYEREFAKYFGRKFATATSSGTAAIHSAIASFNFEPGTEVITSPITDPGTVMPIIFQGLIPVFADVDYYTLNITAENIEKVITDRTKAVIVVHLAGVPCKMEKIVEIAKRYRLKLIEDCAQSHGSKYKGKFTGTFGDMGAFSLMSGKHMTSGGQGGMVITDRERYYWAAKRFADRGKPFGIKNPKGNISLGLNYRMTELEALIGKIQLRKLKKIADRRYRIVEKLRKGFENFKSVKLWERPEDSKPNYWFCFIRVERKKLKVGKEVFAESVKAEGIPVGAHYVIPMYKNPFIKDRRTFGKSCYPWVPYRKDISYKCKMAEKALADHMTLYIHEGWGEEEIEDTLKAFEKVEKAYLK